MKEQGEDVEIMRMSFTIRLSTLPEMEKYCEFVERFNFYGYLKLGSYIIEKDDIQKIFEKCLFKDIQLVICICMEDDVIAIRDFLNQTGLIVKAS